MYSVNRNNNGVVCLKSRYPSLNCRYIRITDSGAYKLINCGMWLSRDVNKGMRNMLYCMYCRRKTESETFKMACRINATSPANVYYWVERCGRGGKRDGRMAGQNFQMNANVCKARGYLGDDYDRTVWSRLWVTDPTLSISPILFLSNFSLYIIKHDFIIMLIAACFRMHL